MPPLRRYVGDYDLDGRIVTLFERDGNLFVRSEGLREITLLAESETVLFLPGTMGSVVAIEGPHGEITGLSVTLGSSGLVVRKVR